MMDHVRIDEGIKRGPRKRERVVPKPHEVETKARNEAGQFMTRYTPELRKQAMDECLLALECGARVEEVGERLNIPCSTLYSWLIGETADRARTQFFDGQSAKSLHEIAGAQSPLELTRARELLAGWVKVAERRDPKSWGIKQEITIQDNTDLGERLRRAKERVIEGECVAVQQTVQLIESVDGAAHKPDSSET